MIRKLASGQFRLYSRKTDPKTGKRKAWGPSRAARPQRLPNVRCSISNGTKGEPAELSPQGDAGSTNALLRLHKAAVAAPTLRPDPKKSPPEECGGQGGVDAGIGQDGSV